MLTIEQQRANLDQLIEFWKTVPPESVWLEYYRITPCNDSTLEPKPPHTCGTLYCIAGHIAEAGLFGTVFAGDIPTFVYGEKNYSSCFGISLGETLFGDYYLLVRRGKHQVDADHPEVSDYELAALRMQYAREKIRAAGTR